MMRFFGLGKRRGATIEAWQTPPFGRDVEKAFVLLDALRDIRDVPGDIVECGVGSGASLGTFAWFLDRMGAARQIHAFDSYEGFPEGTDKDAAGFSPAKKPIYRQFTVEFVKANVTRRCGGNPAPAERIRYVEGFFPGSFAGYAGGPVALLHVDVDLYQSYVDTLDFFVPRMAPGGIILFDEYDRGNDATKWPGAKRAVDEFLARTGLTLERHFTGFSQVRVPAAG